MRKLCRSRADINLVDGKFGTAFGVAIRMGHENIVSLLLDRGVVTNLVSGKFRTALGAAVRKGHENIVSLFLGRGADTYQH